MVCGHQQSEKSRRKLLEEHVGSRRPSIQLRSRPDGRTSNAGDEVRTAGGTPHRGRWRYKRSVTLWCVCSGWQAEKVDDVFARGSAVGVTPADVRGSDDDWSTHRRRAGAALRYHMRWAVTLIRPRITLLTV